MEKRKIKKSDLRQLVGISHIALVVLVMTWTVILVGIYKDDQETRQLVNRIGAITSGLIITSGVVYGVSILINESLNKNGSNK